MFIKPRESVSQHGTAVSAVWSSTHEPPPRSLHKILNLQDKHTSKTATYFGNFVCWAIAENYNIFLQHIFPQMLRLLFHSHGEPMDFFVCLTHVDGNIYLTMLMLNLHEKYCKPSRLVHFFQCFGSGFFPDPDQTFFPESGSGYGTIRIRFREKTSKIWSTSRIFFLHI